MVEQVKEKHQQGYCTGAFGEISRLGFGQWRWVLLAYGTQRNHHLTSGKKVSYCYDHWTVHVGVSAGSFATYSTTKILKWNKLCKNIDRVGFSWGLWGKRSIPGLPCCCSHCVLHACACMCCVCVSAFDMNSSHIRGHLHNVTPTCLSPIRTPSLNKVISSQALPIVLPYSLSCWTLGWVQILHAIIHRCFYLFLPL